MVIEWGRENNGRAGSQFVILFSTSFVISFALGCAGAQRVLNAIYFEL